MSEGQLVNEIFFEGLGDIINIFLDNEKRKKIASHEKPEQLDAFLV